jgi:hypothetical protein
MRGDLQKRILGALHEATLTLIRLHGIVYSVRFNLLETRCLY